MRAPRAGRWGQERKELGGGLGRGARRKEGRQAFCGPPPSPLPPSHTTPMSTPLGMCTCKEEQVPSLTLVPGCKGFQSSGTPGCLRPPPAEPLHSPQFSLRFVASFTGLGSYCTVYLRESAGEGRGPPIHSLPQPFCPSSALSSWLSVFLSNCAS